MAVQYSDEVQKAIDEAVAAVQRQALALGELCLSWSALDDALDALLEPLLDCDRAAVASLASSMEKTEARANVIRKLSVHRLSEERWTEWLNGLLKRVTEELGPTRNRYVHDNWTFQRGNAHRIVKRAYIQKSQARQPDRLIFDVSHTTPPSEVDRLRQCVDRVLYGLEIARNDLMNWRKTGLLQPPPERLNPLCKQRARLLRYPPSTLVHLEQQPPLELAFD